MIMKCRLQIILALIFLVSCSHRPNVFPLSTFDSNDIIQKNRYTILVQTNGLTEKISAKGKAMTITDNRDFHVKSQIIPKNQISQITEKQKDGSYMGSGMAVGVLTGFIHHYINTRNTVCDGCPVGLGLVLYLPFYSLIGAGIGRLIPKYKKARIFKNEEKESHLSAEVR